MNKLCVLFGVFLGAVSSSGQLSSFDSLNGYTAGIENRLTLIRDRGLESVTNVSDSGLSFQYSYMEQKVDPVTERVRRDMDSSVYKVAYQWSGGDWAIGLNLNYDRTSTDYLELNSPSPNPTNGRVKGTGYQAALQAKTALGGFFVGVELGFGKADYDATRQSDVGLSTADFDSDGSFATVRLEYPIYLQSNWVVSPFAAFTTARMKSDGFAEAGGSPDRRIIEDFRIREHLGFVGFDLSLGAGEVRPFLTVAWVERLSSGDFELTSTSPSGANLTTWSVEFPYSGVLALEAGVDWDLADNWRLSPAFRYIKGGDESSWQAGLSLALTF